MNMQTQQIISPASCVSAREELGLSQAKVATETGVSRPYLSQFESGRRVLEDKHQQALLDYFSGHDWKAPTEEEIKHQEPLPYRVRDGFIVLDSIDEEELERLMGEYYENAERINEIKGEAVERGSWSGKIDERAANQKMITLWLLQARQYTIKCLLHGQANISGEFVEQDEAEITTIGEYADSLFYKMFVDKELYFKV